MLAPLGIAWRVGLSIGIMGMCLLMYACAFGYWPIFAVGILAPFALLCTGTAWRLLLMLKDLMMSMFAEPETPEYERTVDGFKEALKYANNWSSRNSAAAIALFSMFLMLIGPAEWRLFVFLAGGVATVAATHFPLIKNRLDAKAKLKAAE